VGSLRMRTNHGTNIRGSVNVLFHFILTFPKSRYEDVLSIHILLSFKAGVSGAPSVL